MNNVYLKKNSNTLNKWKIKKTTHDTESHETQTEPTVAEMHSSLLLGL